MTLKELNSTMDGRPIYAFVDEYGRTIAQAVGESAARALKKYLNGKV